jgi:hypothetical protein
MLEMMDEEDRVGTAVEETKAEIALKLLKCSICFRSYKYINVES